MSLLWPIIGQALRRPGRIASIDDRGELSYGKLLGGAMHLASALDGQTANPHVAVMLPTGGSFSVALLGAWLSGRVAVPVNYLLGPEELAYVLRDCGADTLITAGPMLKYLTDTHGGVDRFLPQGVQPLAMEELDYSGFPPLRWPPRPGDEDLAVLLYTSGTSGRPKGVMLSHGNLASDVYAGIVHSGLTQADTFLGVLPQFHSFGLTALTLLPLTIGARAVYTAKFIPKQVLKLIREHKPDIVLAVPSMYGVLLSLKNAGPEDFACVKLAVSGGEPLPDAVYEGFRDRFGVELMEGYGLTETSPVTHWSTPGQHRRHAVGRALPGVRCLIVDPQDRPLPTGQEGEILLAGPMVMRGYYRLPQQTQEAFVTLRLPGEEPTRFFRTGDIGKEDADGYLSITGRKKEMLIVAGENVFPREIEEVLNAHPSVKDSAVIGRMDGLRGEVPIAFVELKEGLSAEAFDEAALRTWCRERLAGYKAPRSVYRVDALPRNATGKILRRKLKERPEARATKDGGD